MVVASLFASTYAFGQTDTPSLQMSPTPTPVVPSGAPNTGGGFLGR